MARYTGPVCRMCRRDGVKLFLKGPKCFTEKCPVEKRNFPPGQHGQSAKVKKVVGYGLQLREKQKAKRIYFTLETQFRAYYQKAANKTGVTGELLLQQLETRLDNVCYRMGLRPPPPGAPDRSSRTCPGQRPQGEHSFLPVQGWRRDRHPRRLEGSGHARDGQGVRRRSAVRARGSTSTATRCRARSSPCRSAKMSTCRSTSS